MRFILFGLSAAGVAGAAIFTGAGTDAEQVIRKHPAAVYSAFEVALADAEESGKMRFGAKQIPYAIKLERTPGEELLVTITLDEREAGEARFVFEPTNGGTETRVLGDIDLDHSVLTTALKDTPNRHLTLIPAAAWRLGMRKMLADAAEQVEAGIPLTSPRAQIPKTDPSSGSANVSEGPRSKRIRQEAATEPMLDPNKAAEDYMSGGQP